MTLELWRNASIGAAATEGDLSWFFGDLTRLLSTKDTASSLRAVQLIHECTLDGPRAVRCPAILGTVCAYIILIPGLAFNFIHCCQFLTECGKRDSFFDELRTFLSSQAQKGACAFCV